MFRDLNWQPIEMRSGTVSPDSLRTLALDPLFLRYEPQDLLTSIGYFVLTASGIPLRKADRSYTLASRR